MNKTKLEYRIATYPGAPIVLEEPKIRIIIDSELTIDAIDEFILLLECAKGFLNRINQDESK